MNFILPIFFFILLSASVVSGIFVMNGTFVFIPSLVIFCCTAAFMGFLWILTAYLEKNKKISDGIKDDLQNENMQQNDEDIMPGCMTEISLQNSTQDVSVNSYKIITIPKKRCGKLAVVNSETIQKYYTEGQTVSLETLKEKNIIKDKRVGRIKIIITSAVKTAFIIETDIISLRDAHEFMSCGGIVKSYR